MSSKDDLLQKSLSQFETGESEENCLANLPESEAELFRKAVILRHLSETPPPSETYQERRSEFLRHAKEKRSTKMQNPKTRHSSRWILPAAFATGTIVVLFCMTLAIALGGIRVLRGLPEAVREYAPRQRETGKLEATQAPKLDSKGEDSLAEAPAEPILESNIATLVESHGLVEVRDENSAWQQYMADQALSAGYRIRTGALSMTVLRFPDGSEIRLGPSAEISIDKLDVSQEGPRIIETTQWLGEGDHNVAPSEDPASRYEVHTPAGKGTAKGTRFRVIVSTSLIVRFIVDDGEVVVSHLGETVVVVAGQTTSCGENLAPSGPFFYMEGEGRVSQVGASWRIAGSIYQTYSNTTTIGNPQVGDWVTFKAFVHLDGTRIVYQIILKERTQKNQFELRGKVEEMNTLEWVVSGTSIQVNESTLVDPGVQVGDDVKIFGYLATDGSLTATRIQLTVDMSTLKFDITGVVQAITITEWTISEALIGVDSETQVEPGITVGDVVRVRGRIMEDGTWLAQGISLEDEDHGKFSFTGHVESVDPWVISGFSIDVDSETQIDPQVGLGDQVRVDGRILESGLWLAARIQLLSTVTPSEFSFWGLVRSTNPWIVGGVPLVVDENTTITGKTAVSRLVHVSGVVLPDGRLLATEIRGLDLRQGCLNLTSAVRQVNANNIILFNMYEIQLGGGIFVRGELKTASVVLVSGCINEDGTFIVSQVIVIYQLIELPAVNLPSSSSGGGDHGDDDDHDDD